MYIKIVRHEKGDVPYREYLHECEGFSMVNNKDQKTIILNPASALKDRLCFDVDPFEEVYIMNNEGKTIDYYIWTGEDPVKDKTQEQL